MSRFTTIVNLKKSSHIFSNHQEKYFSSTVFFSLQVRATFIQAPLRASRAIKIFSKNICALFILEENFKKRNAQGQQRPIAFCANQFSCQVSNQTIQKSYQLLKRKPIPSG